MKGKAIYSPSGRAAEYSYWAVNFYNGCSADCDYCYCKKGVMAHLWSDKPTLKKSLVNPEKALEIFFKEMKNNLSALREYGLFFNFTSDPFLPETIKLNQRAMEYCEDYKIPVKALTKQTWWIYKYRLPPNVSIGFTLTGMDDMEPGAPPTAERIEAMNYFNGRNTIWASVEPVVDIGKAIQAVYDSCDFVDHYKIGPLSGKKFDLKDVNDMIHMVNKIVGKYSTVYWKEGFIEKMGIIRDSLQGNCVNRDYKFWEKP